MLHELKKISRVLILSVMTTAVAVSLSGASERNAEPMLVDLKPHLQSLERVAENHQHFKFGDLKPHV